MLTTQIRCRFSGWRGKMAPATAVVRAFSSSMDYSNQSRGGLPRFFSHSLPLAKGSVIRVEEDEFHHMTRVLRLNTDDRVELFDGKGRLVKGCVQNIERSGADVLALEDPHVVPYMGPKWHVFAAFGTLKGGRADWLMEKCTELGACSVTPLLTERSPSISENRVDRLLRVILAATKQCQRLHEMVLNPPTRLSDISSLVYESPLALLASAEAEPLSSVLQSAMAASGGLIIIGPEGDFTEKEVEIMVQAGAKPVGLGSLRLRVETATIALLAALMLRFDSQTS